MIGTHNFPLTTNQTNQQQTRMENTDTQLEIMGGDALAQMIRAETDTQITTAKRYPRDFSIAKRKMLSLATLDEETAAGCFYKLARQGKTIEGPSVRMAEIAISCFGNIKAGARVIANDGKTITAQGFCHDLENNVAVAVEVKRRITDKLGKTYSEDMQVVTGNAACAIAFRNAAYKVVPMALIKPVYEAAKKCAVGDIKTLADRRSAALKYFGSLGVNEKQVLAYLNRVAVDSIDLKDVEDLIGLSTAIKEGSTTVDEAFGEEKKETRLNIAPKKKAEPVVERATPHEAVRNLMNASHVDDAEVIDFVKPKRSAGIDVTTVDQLTDAELEKLAANWTEFLASLGGAK